MTSEFSSPRLGVVCCGYVFRRERSVRLVSHEEDGWQFLCGGVDHFGSKDGNLIMIRILLGFDPTLAEVADLPVGWEAERKDQGSSWMRTRSNTQSN